MKALRAYPTVALDESARDFISTFLSHVETLSGCDRDPSSITRVKTLLLAAIEQCGDASETAWSVLYGTITEIVAAANDARDVRGARAYLRSFLEENADLAAFAGRPPLRQRQQHRLSQSPRVSAIRSEAVQS